LKRILQVIDTLEVGGAENVFVDNIIRFQNEFNYHVLVLRNVSKNIINQRKISQINQIEYLDRRSKFSLLTAYKLHLCCKEYQIIHIHLRHTFRYVGWVKLLFRGNYNLILHDHTGNIDKTFESLPFLESFIIKPKYYIGVSSKLVDWATIKWKIKIENSGLLINLPPVDFSKNDNEKIEKNKRIIQVGNIKPIKNQIFAAQLARAIGLEIDFYGNIQDQRYFQSLMIENNKSKLVNIHSGVYIKKKIIQPYKMALCTSISESGPMVLIEYLIAGVPFLAYKTGEISDSIFEFFPDFFLTNWCFNEWLERFSEIENVNLNSEENLRKIDLLMIKYFDSDTYRLKLLDIYNKLSQP
jgi:glycosyltransferase involved in cell wall biosynthesis